MANLFSIWYLLKHSDLSTRT